MEHKRNEGYVIVSNANPAIFKAISWREQFNFQRDDDEVHFALDQNAEVDFYSVSPLKQQSADRHVAPLGHNILILSQPVFALFLSIYINCRNALLMFWNVIPSPSLDWKWTVQYIVVTQ